MTVPSNGTQRLTIRLIERRDIEEARCLHNDDRVLFWLTDLAHVSEAQQESWFQAVSNSSKSYRYVARSRLDDRFIGVFRIDRLDMGNRNCYVGADVVPALQKRGYANEMFSYMLPLLFDQWGLHRVGLATMENNRDSLALYRRLGFTEEGRERGSIFRHGRFFDLIIMGLFASEWRKATSA